MELVLNIMTGILIAFFTLSILGICMYLIVFTIDKWGNKLYGGIPAIVSVVLIGILIGILKTIGV